MAKDRIDRDEEDLVRLYLTDIGQYVLLTKDDEVRLAKEIEEGKAAEKQLENSARMSATRKRELRKVVRLGTRAERQFVQSNLRLVVSIAKKYQASGLPLLDLIQEGNLGLMHAVEKFDWRKGFKFSTYATWWIRQAITRGIANTGRTIRLPVHAGDTLARLQKARSRLELKFGRPATRSPRPCVSPTSHSRSANHSAKMAMPNLAMSSKTVRWNPHSKLQQPRCFPRRSTDSWRHSTLASAKSSPCALVSIVASHAPWKKLVKRSTSRANASAKSKLVR
jgi:RNA polymerase sigma factor (sigma-70 family)